MSKRIRQYAYFVAEMDAKKERVAHLAVPFFVARKAVENAEAFKKLYKTDPSGFLARMKEMPDGYNYKLISLVIKRGK